jgi:hypothetical protein
MGLFLSWQIPSTKGSVPPTSAVHGDEQRDERNCESGIVTLSPLGNRAVLLSSF